MDTFKSKDVKGITIYSFDYLTNNDLDDSELSNLLDKKGLLYSIIYNMFYYANIKIKDEKIMSLIKNTKYYNKFHWKNKAQFYEFESILSKVIKNIYSYSDAMSKYIAQWYMSVYGFSIK